MRVATGTTRRNTDMSQHRGARTHVLKPMGGVGTSVALDAGAMGSPFHSVQVPGPRCASGSDTARFIAGWRTPRVAPVEAAGEAAAVVTLMTNGAAGNALPTAYTAH